MRMFLFRWIVITLAVMATPYLVSGVYVESFGSALAAAGVLAVFNVILKPILVILTLPLTIFSLGLFLLIINGFLFMLASYVVSGLLVADFFSAFLAALLVTIVSWASNFALYSQNGQRRVVFISNDFNGKRVIDLKHQNDRWE